MTSFENIISAKQIQCAFPLEISFRDIYTGGFRNTIFPYILGFVSVEDLVTCRRVNKAFRDIIAPKIEMKNVIVFVGKKKIDKGPEKIKILGKMYEKKDLDFF